ncbi:MAG: dihydroorotate dehydrogenase electron transfer subunit [Bacillota bacterium]|nr:dihydroorotate dehydrogenase electron transfer subunit [Bacillota bacterium]
MREQILTITENRKIAPKTFSMTLKTSKGDHGIRRPGQFINIKLDGFFLRRPISVCSWEDDSLTIIYKVVGAGTEAMSHYEPEKSLNVLLPLGNGFDTSVSGEHPVLIGGGAGVPPMYGLCRQLLAEGRQPTVVLGFNKKEESFYIEEFKTLGADVVVATADGSLGVEGFVTDALENLSYTYFYACGPEAMLKALDGKIPAGVGGQLSFEERMGCGFGACMGCSCETKYGNKRICKEGPVLERGEILW